MQTRALGLVILAALFVVAGKPQAQPLATDPVIPMPIIQDNGPGTEVVLAGTNASTGASKASDSTEKADSSAAPIGPDKAGPFGTIKQPSTAFEICYLFYSEDSKPGSVVLWRAIGEGAKFDSREVRERISLQGGQGLKGVYVLQSDYHVQKLPLSAQDSAHVFDLLESGTDGKVLVADAIWKGKIAPCLKKAEVEYDAERSKEIRKLAAQRAREAKKAGRTTVSQKAQPAKIAGPAKTNTSAKTTSAKASHKRHDMDKAMARR